MLHLARLFFIPEPELRYALGSKAQSGPICHVHAGGQASNYTLHIGAAHPFSYAIAKPRPPLASRPLFHPYRCAATKLLRARMNPNSNWEIETHCASNVRSFSISMAEPARRQRASPIAARRAQARGSREPPQEPSRHRTTLHRCDTIAPRQHRSQPATHKKGRTA